jgi:hypothetical protein
MVVSNDQEDGSPKTGDCHRLLRSSDFGLLTPNLLLPKIM